MQSIVKKLQPIVSMFSSGKHVSIYLIFPYFYPDTGAHLGEVLLRNFVAVIPMMLQCSMDPSDKGEYYRRD